MNVHCTRVTTVQVACSTHNNLVNLIISTVAVACLAECKCTCTRHQVTAPSRDCGMRHLGNKHSTGRCFQFQVGFFSRKERCGKPGRRRRPMTYPYRCLHGSWGCAGRKPRVFRCLASKTRHRENRGFLPACPCDPRRQAGGMASPPDFPGLAFRSLS